MTSPNDVKALKERVAQLEATVAAMRNGQLDAILDGESEALYISESAERTFRLMVERMVDGALTLDREDGQILYCNAAFADLVRVPVSTILGRVIEEFIAAEDHDAAKAILSADKGARFDLRLLSAGLRVPVSVAAAGIESLDGDIVCVTVHDERAHRIAVFEGFRESSRNMEMSSAADDVLGPESTMLSTGPFFDFHYRLTAFYAHHIILGALRLGGR